MKVISQITIVTREGVAIYSVGDTINEDKIVKIKDLSLEYPNGLESIYDAVNDKGETLVRIENCSVVVIYKDGEE